MSGDPQSGPVSPGLASPGPAEGGGPPAPVLPARPRLQTLLRIPGLAAIGFYMFLLAGVDILAVAASQFPPLFLIFSAFFIAAGLGLLLLLRWAWAMSLATVALLTGLFLWKFSTTHEVAFIAQGLLNLVFFLYLVRPEVRQKLR
jgi:hypothetical protein